MSRKAPVNEAPTEIDITEALQGRIIRYDKAGDQHYDVISAFIKSMRGSDPDAAVFWLHLMLEGGEDPEFITRRMVVFASEDVGLADPTALPVAAIQPSDGWCDDPASPDYNRQVQLPIAASHEHLWRLDGIYDVVVVLGHNDDPPVAGAGSAIFLHLARPDYAPTEGCVAVAREDMFRLLADCETETFLSVGRS